MGTRATYNIEGQVFYCHWDGYREGAALRFSKMIAALTVPKAEGPHVSIDAAEDRRGGAAFAFIRGNMDAEPAHMGAHDGHGDTEWRYDVEASAEHGLTVTSHNRRFDSNTWTPAEPMPLAEFIAIYGAEWDVPRICQMNPPGWYGSGKPILATLDAARQLAELEQRISERYTLDNPNRASHLDRAAAWRASIEAAEPAAA